MVSLPSPDRILLHAREYVAQVAVSHEMRMRMKYEEFQAYNMDQLVMRLRAEVYGEKLTEGTRDIFFTHQFEFPKNPWQHIKDRWFPQWYLRRRPVKYITHESRHINTTKVIDWALFPDLPYYPQEFGKPIRYREVQDVFHGEFDPWHRV